MRRLSEREFAERSVPVESQHSHFTEGSSDTHKFHCCHLASSRKMRQSSIGIRNFGNNLSAIFHGQKQGFVEHAIRILFDGYTGF
jgi:hypothetical protein